MRVNWESEPYVKLYTRDTVTWRSWGWQARTVFLHLLRGVDGAGLLPLGGLLASQAVSVFCGLPVEVVDAGLPELLKSGAVEATGKGHLWIPKFVEAQEARKTNAQSKRDQKERYSAKQRLQVIETLENSGQTKADEGRQRPPSAQLSSAHLKDLSKPPAVVDQFRTFWNANMPAQIPRWRDHTEKRNRAVAAWARKYPQERWREVVDAVAAQPFLTGSSGWTLSVDWLVKGDNATRVLERQYAGTKVQPRAKVAHF